MKIHINIIWMTHIIIYIKIMNGEKTRRVIVLITKETREESFKEVEVKKQIRYEQILDRLITGTKTAKEIAVELYELKLIPSTERNYTAPRLTELEKKELVRVIEKTRCKYTGKTVAVYEITTKGIEQRYNQHIPRLD